MSDNNNLSLTCAILFELGVSFGSPVSFPSLLHVFCFIFLPLPIRDIGAYSSSKGHEYVRESVARFIAKRDGKDATTYTNVDDIFLTDGASPAVQLGLRFTIRGPQDGVMIPIPQYPLYSASIPLFGGAPVPYYLDESRNWALDVKELARSVETARNNVTSPFLLSLLSPSSIDLPYPHPTSYFCICFTHQPNSGR